ncbi:MAG: recombination regulator RecX [Lysobacter sp.]|nr:recombination regulator RecX [Lysobacter sp.]
MNDVSPPRPVRKPRRTPVELTPVQRALSLLTRREHSKKELARKLAARGVEFDDAQAAIEKLAGNGWQDDGRFAASLLRARAGNGYGPIRIRAELAMHGLDRAAVEAVLDAFDGDWTQNARDVARRRFGEQVFSDRGLQRKAADFLFRRGFASEHIRAATRVDPDN